MTATTSRSRRLLVPLATMLAAGAIAVASGATFTSSTANTISTYASGTLTHTNSKNNQAIFNATGMRPGQSVTGDVVITNTGSLPATFKLTETATNNFADKGLLKLTVTAGGNNVYSGEFGKLQTVDLGSIPAGQSRTYTFTAQLDANAGNDNQGKTATASYTWNATPTAP